MNILLITEFFPGLVNPIFTGGVEARCYYIARYLSKINNVTVISRKINGQQNTEKSRNLKIIRIGPPQKSSEASIISLISRFVFQFQALFEGLKTKPDIVEGSNFITYLPAFSIGKLLNIPKIAWYPDVFIGKWASLFGSILGFFGEITEKIVLKLNWDGLIAISQSTRKKLINNNVKTIKVIPCGVDLKEYSKAEKFKKPTVIVISRLEKYKNVDKIILAVKKLKNINLIIIGSGPEEENLKIMMPQATFKKNLPRSELNKLLEKSHILCHASKEEGFGIVLIEGLAAGTPYIAADIPAVREITERGKGGILIKDNNFARSINLLIKNKNLYNKKQIEGKILVNKYLWENISKVTYEYYRRFTNI